MSIDRRSLFLLVSCAVILTANVAFSQDSVENNSNQENSPTISASKAKKLAGRSIEEAMTPEEFQAAGLNKLSEDELQHLDAWLQGYRQTTEKHATEEAQKKADVEIKKATEQARVAAPPERKLLVDRVTSRIDGTFVGLTGHTVIKLEDGTAWKQGNKDDRYKSPVTDHPMASVVKGPFGYKMRIEGTPEFYVNPIRSKE